MTERYEVALREALADLTQMAEVRAILLFGTAATGQPAAHSDLDLYVVLKEEAGWHQIAVRRYAGVEAEVHFAPAHWWRQQLENRAPVIVSAFATGRIVYGEAEELVSLARGIWAEGPGAPGQAEIDRYRYHLTDLAGDLADLADGDPLMARYLGTLLLDRALEAYCRLNRLWGDKPKRRIAYVAQRDPDLGAMARAFLERGSPALVQAVVDRVLAPFGGRLVTYEGERRPVG